MASSIWPWADTATPTSNRPCVSAGRPARSCASKAAASLIRYSRKPPASTPVFVGSCHCILGDCATGSLCVGTTSGRTGVDKVRCGAVTGGLRGCGATTESLGGTACDITPAFLSFARSVGFWAALSCMDVGQNKTTCTRTESSTGHCQCLIQSKKCPANLR